MENSNPIISILSELSERIDYMYKDDICDNVLKGYNSGLRDAQEIIDEQLKKLETNDNV